MSAEDKAFSVLSLVDDEAVPVGGGSIQWIPVRRRLGIQAFGTNAYRAARVGDTVIEDHVESPGQEELYVVVSGRTRFVIDGDEVDVPAGGAIFLPRPDVRRGGVALEDDTTVLAVGGWVDRPYHSLPWEPIYLTQESMDKGDWSTVVEILEREAGEHRDSAFIRFRLACCRAQLGEHELALSELGRAIEANPGMRDRAAHEELLSPLHDLETWNEVIEV